ncbi:unnamed protein product [Thlaspi arvense]|uniref:Uncharacterized protein n=1 Tax=Thlaspi arvense TaxID=13288 RepID=A0AAU9RVZ1_THLAR|nr:unnamed protein product [Thlaspi arvense]
MVPPILTGTFHSKSIASLSKAKTDLIVEKECHDTGIATKDSEYLALKADFDKQEVRRQERKVRMSASAGAIVRQWELVQEFKRGKGDGWDVREAEAQYREVSIEEAKIDGKTPPVFPETFTGFSAGALVNDILDDDDAVDNDTNAPGTN